MSMYICNHCDGLKDGDWNTCHEDPNNPNELICDDCNNELDDDDDDDLP